MTPEEIRIAMAEVDGWELDANVGNHPDEGYIVETFYRNKSKSVFAYALSELPNYPFDLNAVNGVEKKLNLWHRRYYCDQLNRICLFVDGDTQKGMVTVSPVGDYHDADEEFVVISATALQRCTAILKTLGKWKESGE